ncbi:MAG: peptidoglycan DD-metalloendopeptidase family protein [Thermodesulfobacteriota bacterium]
MIDKGLEIRPDALSGKRQEPGDRKLRKACEDFEAVFTYQLLRSMRRTVEKSDLFHGGTGEDMYESMLDQELSKSMAGVGKGGLADQLYQQLRPKDLSGEIHGDLSLPPRPLQGAETPQPPLMGRVSSGFGWRIHPIFGEKRFHKGLDIAAEEGSIIRASMAGRVVDSEFQEGYGNVVVVEHGRGYSTLYAHNRDNLVREGEWVDAGAPLALVGSTGRSTGPHLHFEVRRHGRNLDPAEFLGTKTGVGSFLSEKDI